MTTEDMRARLAKLDASCLSDPDKSIRAVDPAIQLVSQSGTMAGRAFTVACDDDFLGVIKAVEQAQPGDVVVVDGKGGHRALCGELVASEAERRGLAGIVIDGGLRDTAFIAGMSFPVYCRYRHPVAGTAVKPGELQVPVTCGGIKVHPGDYVIGDRDGIVVGSEAEIAAALPVSEQIQATEAKVYKALSGGKSLIELLNFEEHYAAVLAGKESKLAFRP